MEKEKYYTPTIEEFHVGFEFEFETGIEGWKKFIIKNDRIDATLRNLETFKTQFRVKYLDGEDIESFGFKEDEKVKGFFNYKPNEDFDRDRYWLQFDMNNGKIWIRISDEQSEVDFSGFLKNKSEFSRLLKQLSII
tara:strand:+ start:3367 stop:3774 length:408 start_codon:yes stop_codon:yes gene_type:complete